MFLRIVFRGCNKGGHPEEKVSKLWTKVFTQHQNWKLERIRNGNILVFLPIVGSRYVVRALRKIHPKGFIDARWVGGGGRLRVAWNLL